jgi:hypothetical protein
VFSAGLCEQRTKLAIVPFVEFEVLKAHDPIGAVRLIKPDPLQPPPKSKYRILREEIVTCLAEGALCAVVNFLRFGN